MAKREAGSVFQKDDGYWGYRFIVSINGKRIERRGSFDECGNKFLTKREASAAREAAIVALSTEKTIKPKPVRKLVEEVFEEFCAEGRKDRAYQTIRKQDSIWENHLRDRFGNRYVDEISCADVVDYLAELCYENGKAFKYVESFLKMFYLIFGQAYSRNYLDVDSYITRIYLQSAVMPFGLCTRLGTHRGGIYETLLSLRNYNDPASPDGCNKCVCRKSC